MINFITVVMRLLLLSFLVLLLASCMRRREHEHIYPKQELVDRFYYKPGTYWVYVDTLTGKTDSIRIFENEKITGTGQNNGNGNPITIETLISRGEIFNDINAVIDTIEIRVAVNYDVRIFNRALLNLFYYPLPEKRQSMSLNENVFPNVFEVHSYSSSNLPEKHSDWLYISEEVGLVKMRIDHSGATAGPSINKVYELLRWHIVK